MNKIELKIDWAIGIDPSFRKGGFGCCFFNINTKEIIFKMFDSPIDFFFYISTGFIPTKENISTPRALLEKISKRLDSPSIDRYNNCVVIVEDSNLQNTTFNMKGSKSVVAKFSRNVGTNQAVSNRVVKECELLFGTDRVKGISPKEKGSKLNGVFFKNMLLQMGVTPPKKSNQDQRDAAKLAFLYKRYFKNKG